MDKEHKISQTKESAISDDTVLGNVLLSLGKKSIYIPDYIKQNAKTRRVPKLKAEFEELIRKDKRFYGVRTSLIFHLKELKRLPRVWGYLFSHINVA